MQKKLSIVLVGIVFGAILVFLSSRGMLGGVAEFTNTVTSPVTTIFSESSNGITGFFSGIFNIGKLQEENASLSSEADKMSVELARLEEVQKENESLRKDLGFIKKTKFEYEAAQVTAYDPSNIRGMLTINKGKAAGLEEGMAAVNEGFLIGRISEVGEGYSKIQLITDPTSAIPISIQGTSTNGIAKGELGSGVIVEKIPQGDKVENGNVVITSGLGGEIPRGIIIGEVQEIESKENSLFITADVRPKADLTNILKVLIIKE